MIFSYEWLQELIPNTPSPQELLDRLTLSSVEVEEIIQREDELGDVVVGEVLETAKHPAADKLNVGQFDVGEEKPRQIVFGGVAELKVGQKIPIALAPTTITGGVKIKKVKLRGEISEGMCCLNSELGIFDKQGKVHQFNKDVKNGTVVQELLPNSDVLIDIDNKSMTHRADLFCHNNMAREIAAVFDCQTSIAEYKKIDKTNGSVDVTIKDKVGCPRYIGAILEVQVGPAPCFMVDRLQACGIKSINNVVDITNYVMLEIGEPMHAFDLDKVEKKEIIVRKAKQGEKIVTLDKDEKTLDDSMLVIADAKKPIAVAGVIGGVDSSVTDNTTQIILEAANFEAIGIRKTAQKLGVRTESAIRWEKGLPFDLAEYATARAIELLQEYAEAKVIGVTDKQEAKSTKMPEIELPAAYIKRLAGISIPASKVKNELSKLQCQVKTSGKGDELVYKVIPPWFRQDLNIPEDLIEEIIRLYGIQNLQEDKVSGELDVPIQEVDLPVVTSIRNQLSSLGCYEVSNYSFYGEKIIEKCGLRTDKEHVEILNPLSDDLAYLRTSLLPRLLDNTALNQRYKEKATLFEVGHVYFTDREVKQLGIVSYGRKEPYRYVRGIVEELLRSLHVDWQVEIVSKSASCEYWGVYQGNEALSLKVGNDIIGTIGQVDGEISKKMKITGDVGFCALSIPVLTKHSAVTAAIKPICAYPAIPLDLSIIVDEEVPWSEIENEVVKHGNDWLQSIEVFDVYRGDKIEANKKSIAFHLVLQSDRCTLEMTEIEKWREKLVEILSKKIGAILRDK